MPNFDMAAAAKGSEAIRDSNERRGNGNYRPFLPQIYWRKKSDQRYVLILNPLEEIVRVEFHRYIDTDNGPRQVIARTDPGVRDNFETSGDPISDDWGYTPQRTNIMIAVELEPSFREVNGRQRVDGFEVGTKEIERRVRNEDGELTDERETIDVPLIGFIAQSPSNFGNKLDAYGEGDVHRTPFKITKIGEKTDTDYMFVGFPDDIPIDFTNLLEYIDNVSFIQDKEEVLDLIDGLKDDAEMALAIGRYLLALKLEELADPEFYDEVYKSISKPAKYGNNKDKKDKSSSNSRGSRHGNRNSRSSRSSHAEEDVPARSREESEEVSTPSSAKERLESIKQRKRERDAAKNS